jgi:beta-carotene 3-hydroxylase
MSLATILFCSAIAISTFLLWEFVAWFTHRFVMHGLLWSWHKSHHTKHDDFLEGNDLFAVVFSTSAILLFSYATLVFYNPYPIAVAIGITCYGMFYFIFHDIIVHQRIRWIIKRKSKYRQRMINAHHVHHSRHTKKGCEAFWFLFASKKYELTPADQKNPSRKTPQTN